MLNSSAYKHCMSEISEAKMRMDRKMLSYWRKELKNVINATKIV